MGMIKSYRNIATFLLEKCIKMIDIMSTSFQDLNVCEVQRLKSLNEMMDSNSLNVNLLVAYKLLTGKCIKYISVERQVH